MRSSGSAVSKFADHLQTPLGPLQLQLPPPQSIVQLCAVLQSALHEPPGQWKVQSAPLSHWYEQLAPLHVVSQVPPAHVQSIPLQVSWAFVLPPLLQAATRAMTMTSKREVRSISYVSASGAPPGYVHFTPS